MNTLKGILGLDKTNYSALVKKGAVILDVRSKSEFYGGHIKDALNIPVSDLTAKLNRLQDKNTPIITCCASGMRSATAAGILKKAGFTKVYNGGGWASLKQKI